MRPDCQLRAFNAEMTGSPTIVLLPCSHSYPPTLIPLFGDDGEGFGEWCTALSSQGTSSPRTWCSSAISPSSFGPSLVILGCFPPQLGPWAYYPKWAGVPRSFGPTITNYIVKVIQNIYDMTKNVIGWHFKNIINKYLNYLFVINDTLICNVYVVKILVSLVSLKK